MEFSDVSGEEDSIDGTVLERLASLSGTEKMAESVWTAMQPGLDSMSQKIVEMQEQQIVRR